MRDNRYTVKHKFIFSASLVGIIAAIWCTKVMLFGPSLIAATAPKPESLLNKPYSQSALGVQKQENEKFSLNLAPRKIKHINPRVLELAFVAYKNAKSAGFGDKEYLTIVDYSLPSTERRMWVIDMRNKEIVFNTHVAHGIGSGDNYAKKFSNQHGSRMSSLGLFLTGDIYQGHYGQSLNLHGLDGKFNSNALARRIVVHPAHYVSEGAIRQMGRLGRSFGCLALNKDIANKIMHTIKGGSLVFCYYPDQAWLKESKMLARM